MGPSNNNGLFSRWDYFSDSYTVFRYIYYSIHPILLCSCVSNKRKCLEFLHCKMRYRAIWPRSNFTSLCYLTSKCSPSVAACGSPLLRVCAHFSHGCVFTPSLRCNVENLIFEINTVFKKSSKMQTLETWSPSIYSTKCKNQW